MAEQATAETQKGEAATQLEMAQELRREAQVASDAAALQQEHRDIDAAQDAAQAAADEAAIYAGYASENVMYANGGANNARASANKAKAARTDYATANAHAMNAGAAAAAAAAAQMTISGANADAQAANTAAMGATTSDDAEMYQQQAEAARDDAIAANLIAYNSNMTAREEAAAAALAADTHILELFKLANAGHIATAPDPDANTDLSEAQLIAKLRSTHRAQINAEIAEAAAETTNGNSQTMASVNVFNAGDIAGSTTWPYDADTTADADDDGANNNDDDGLLQVSIDIGGIDYTSDRGDNLDTEDEIETDHPLNFTGERGLGDFGHGFEISATTYDTATPPAVTNRTRVLVFTDKEQASRPIPAMSVSLTNEPVTSVARVMPTARPAITGDNIHDFAGTYDHDGNSDTDPIPGTFDCVDPTTCTVTRTGTADNGDHVADQTMVTAISGYKFTGTGTTAAVPSMEDETYLAFGVWLSDDADATDLDARYTFGAFAGGGSPYEEADASVADIEGTATYNGKAAGVHATASRMNYFEGDATLRANFRDVGVAGNGTIIGEISNIYSGGDALTGYGDNTIYLRLSDQDVASPEPNNIANNGTFNGRARLGAGTEGDDGELDYPFNGMWQGELYNQVEQDDDTDADETAMPPMSAAGTFGVTMADDGATMDVNEQESFVGAFGAHRTSSPRLRDCTFRGRPPGRPFFVRCADAPPRTLPDSFISLNGGRELRSLAYAPFGARRSRAVRS